ncbi:MAG TPA: GH3 auxin-responsive promoter family protein [Stellaceae bacterium]|nr:GH3 auxin-responsive promoter family protein [Stellaceae bacterium]
MLDATPLLRLYARRRKVQLAAENAPESQRSQLLRLVRQARETAFGVAHGFVRIGEVEDFQRRVPLRSYEDFWRDYWQPRFPLLTDLTWPGTIPYFAATSGTTTGKTKFIPFSREMSASNRGAALDLLTHHLAARPRSRLLAGKNFMLGGSTDLVEQAPGVSSGDLSGIAANDVPWWARPRYFPPRRYALMTDWEQKIDTLARLSLREDIRSLSGTPSWVLLFFAKLAELRPELPRRSTSYYPELELFIHGGINFAPYRAQFEELLEGSRAESREVYAASEGFIAAADRGYGDGLRLIVDRGIFYEFVPADEVGAAEPARHWLATAQPGVNYAIVLSTCAGLWSYLPGDTVKFVELRPPRLLITGRLSYFLSAFGEHLIAEEIETAVAAAAAEIGSQVADFTVTPIFPSAERQRGGHLYVVEFSAPVASATLARFARALDESLSAQNQDYRDHRSGGFGMDAPRVVAAKPGSFAQWMKSRGQIGGQHKVPRVIQDRELFRSLEEFLMRTRGAP